jgi:enamine deaminase RidA (YjgF/YER057c/UK114 family)
MIIASRDISRPLYGRNANTAPPRPSAETSPIPHAVQPGARVARKTPIVPKNPDLDIEGQTRDVLATIEQLLASANSDKSRLLSVQLFLKDLADFPKVNAIYVDWLKDCEAPSRATIQADLVNPNWLIEIAVIAAQK